MPIMHRATVAVHHEGSANDLHSSHIRTDRAVGHQPVKRVRHRLERKATSIGESCVDDTHDPICK